jgi:hypothetical protein
MTSLDLIPVKTEDFLDEDPVLRGQNFVCLSFLSPEDVIKRKDVFLFQKYISNFSKEMKNFFVQLSEKYEEEVDKIKMIKERYRYLFNSDNIQEEYNFFVTNNPELEKEYFAENNFQTTIRGIKVRGTFDTMREASIRAQVLKKLDDKFNIYIATVGSWVPWAPDPDEIENQEYAETHLNSLMKKYKENTDKKDVFYEERKRDLQFMKVKTKIEEKDQWIKNKDEDSEIEENNKLEKILEEVLEEDNKLQKKEVLL